MKLRHLELVWLRGIGALRADAQDSYLGTLWWMLEPLVLAALFYLAFSSGLRGSGGLEFAFFLICGLLPYKWTASCLGGGANALLSNKGIMGQTHIPKWIFPTAVNLSYLVRFLFTLPILMIFVLYGGGEVSMSWLTLFYLLCIQILLNLGISYLFSSVVPLIPDIAHLVPVITMTLLFTSGIFFDINDRPEDIQQILRLNPLVDVVSGYRNVLLEGKAISISDLSYPLWSGLMMTSVGVVILHQFDRYYPRAMP